MKYSEQMLIRCIIFIALVQTNKTACTAGTTTPNTRMNCGQTMWYANHMWPTEKECTARGCCWDAAVPDAPFCFYPHGGKFFDMKLVIPYINSLVFDH